MRHAVCNHFYSLPLLRSGRLQRYLNSQLLLLFSFSLKFLNGQQWDDDMVLVSGVPVFPSLPLLLTLALCLIARKGHRGTVYESRDGVEHKFAITISRRRVSCDG